LFLRLCQLGITLLNINNCRFTIFFSKEISLLNHKIAASTSFDAVITLHCLLECELVFNYATFLAVCMREPAVSVAKAIGFISGFFGQLSNLLVGICFGCILNYSVFK
jgi:hypothetical protein